MLLVLRFPTNRMQKAPLGSLLPLVRRVGFASRSAELETFAPSSGAAASSSNPDAQHKKRLAGDAFCIRCAGLDSPLAQLSSKPSPPLRGLRPAVRILMPNTKSASLETLFVSGAPGWIRTNEDRSQLVYSQSPLTAWVPTRCGYYALTAVFARERALRLRSGPLRTSKANSAPFISTDT